jgi:hypothetical protein
MSSQNRHLAPALVGTGPQAVALDDALHRCAPEAGQSQLSHLPGNLAATPAGILPRQSQHELFRLWVGSGASRSALGVENPVGADDLPVPADQGCRLSDHQTVQQLRLPHSDTSEQQSQLLDAAQPRALPHLTLEDEDLLAQSQYSAVTIVTEQPGD